MSSLLNSNSEMGIPRRVQQGLSEVVVVLAQLRDRRSHEHGFPSELPLQAFLGVSTLLFAANAAVTSWCASMSAMGEMPMPGGWTMSMAWMRMPGQTWTGVAASFLGMWVVMMVAMMLPSFVPCCCAIALTSYKCSVWRAHGACER
jgi:predicted metal-binding membrane protein